MASQPFSIYNIRKQVCEQAGFPSESSPCAACFFILGTEENPFGGGESIVFALEDHNGTAVCMRIQRESTQWTSYTVEKEVKFRAAMESLGISRFQKVLGHAPTGSNLIPAPFITMTWARGSSLRWIETFPTDLRDRNKVIYAIAKIAIDLLKIQSVGASANDYATSRISRKIERAERGEYRGGNVEGCHRQLDLLKSYWIPDLDRAPYIFDHGDLSSNNIIVDERFTVTSVIDLGWAEMVPLQFAAAYPRFLTHEPVRNASCTDFNWQTNNTDMMKRDRQFYLDCIQETACSEGGIAQVYYEVLARPDERRRYWWFRAISQLDIHQAMCACDWDPFKEDDSRS